VKILLENLSRKKPQYGPILSLKVIRQTSSFRAVTAHQVAAQGALHLVRDSGKSVTPDLSPQVPFPCTYTSTW